MRENENETAIDRARSGDDTVARNFLILHPEIDAVVLDIGVQFFKTAFVEQHIKPLARGQLALGVLRINALLAATHAGGFSAAFHLGNIG